MPNALNIQATFNSILASVARNYGTDSQASEIAKERLKLAQSAEARKQKETELKEQKVGVERQKAEIKASQEARLQEELLDRQLRTSGLVAERKANAALLGAEAGALKERTRGEAQKRKEKEYKFQQKKAKDKSKALAGQNALQAYSDRTSEISGQKQALSERKKMLAGEQVTLEL